MLRRSLRALLQHDPSLVSLPEGVGKCHVFRNVCTPREEDLICEEFYHVMQRDGQTAYDGSSKVSEKKIRNVMVDLYGMEPYTKLRDYQARENKNIPGMIWSPTAQKVFAPLSQEYLGGEADAGRLIEHHVPGFEMHVEGPTVGQGFLFLNLMSETVLQFDDESTGRQGMVLLPQRSLMAVSGELRWGWRFGERVERTHTFVGPKSFRKRVEPDLRVSLQVWRFAHGLVDQRQLQEQLESLAEKRLEAGAAGGDEEEKGPAIPGVPPPSGNSEGQGTLGGDLVVDTRTKTGKEKSKEDLARDAARYKAEFQNLQDALKDMAAKRERGEQIPDDFMNTRFTHDETDIEYGFDPENPQNTWESIEAKMQYYNDRIQSMDYGEERRASSEPRPTNLKEAINKFSPKTDNRLDILSTLEKEKPPGHVPGFGPGGR